MARRMSPTTSCSGVVMLETADSSPLNCAPSHCESTSPPVIDGSASGSLFSRSASLRDPADTSGTSGSIRSSIPSRFRSTLSFSSQSMSLSVLSIFSSLRAEDCDVRALPVHQVRFIHIDRCPVMEERDEDGEPDRRFGCRDRHDEKDEDESVELMKLPRVCEEGQVDGLHHQLDRHEDRDAVLAR